MAIHTHGLSIRIQKNLGFRPMGKQATLLVQGKVRIYLRTAPVTIHREASKTTLYYSRLHAAMLMPSAVAKIAFM